MKQAGTLSDARAGRLGSSRLGISLGPRGLAEPLPLARLPAWPLPRRCPLQDPTLEQRGGGKAAGLLPTSRHRPLLFLWLRGGLVSSTPAERDLFRNLGALRSSFWASVKASVSSFFHCRDSGSL